MFNKIMAYVITIGFLFSIYLVFEAFLKQPNKPEDIEKSKDKLLQEKHEVDSHKDLVLKILFSIGIGCYGLYTYSFTYVLTNLVGLFNLRGR